MFSYEFYWPKLKYSNQRPQESFIDLMVVCLAYLLVCISNMEIIFCKGCHGKGRLGIQVISNCLIWTPFLSGVCHLTKTQWFKFVFELHVLYTNNIPISIVLFILDLSQEMEKCCLLPKEAVIKGIFLHQWLNSSW